MKFLALLLLTPTLFASTPEIKEAPLEWLITSTLQEKIDDHGHLETHDPLVESIFENIHYDVENDNIILTSNKSTHELRGKLIQFIDGQNKRTRRYDPKYQRWLKEAKNSPLKVNLFKINYKPKGFYYFNHVHTNISQDNAEMKWLKITPKKTFRLIEKFLKRRRAQGTVAFTDHDSDEAFDKVVNLNQSRLKPLRGVEWGGKTHMCLIDIKENWDELANGRTYEGETSVIKSRSSGGFRIVNHPNRKKPFPYTSWLDADGVEVWNTILENSPFLLFNINRSNNRTAFLQWKNALKTNKRYTALAGSDFHFSIPCLKERTLVYPVNYIPAEDKELTREYLFKGRSSFVTRPTAPKLSLSATKNNKTAHMGDSVKVSDNLQVELIGDFSDVNKRIGSVCYNTVRKFYKLFTFWKKRRWEIRFYNLNNELIAKRYINPKWYSYKKHFKAVINMPINGKDLIRAELWSINRKSKSVDLLGATNPIYINW